MDVYANCIHKNLKKKLTLLGWDEMMDIHKKIVDVRIFQEKNKIKFGLRFKLDKRNPK